MKTAPLSPIETARAAADAAADNLQNIRAGIASARTVFIDLEERQRQGQDVGLPAFRDARDNVELQQLGLEHAEQTAKTTRAEYERMLAADTARKLSTDPALSGEEQVKAEDRASDLIGQAVAVLATAAEARNDRLVSALADADLAGLPKATRPYPGASPRLANPDAPVHQFKNGLLFGTREVLPVPDVQTNAREALAQILAGTFTPTTWTASESCPKVNPVASGYARRLFELAARHAGTEGEFVAWNADDWTGRTPEGRIGVQVLDASVTDQGIITALVVRHGVGVQLPRVGPNTAPARGDKPDVSELRHADGFALTEVSSTKGGTRIVGWLPEAMSAPLAGEAALEAIRFTLGQYWVGLSWEFDGKKASGTVVPLVAATSDKDRFKVGCHLATTAARRGDDRHFQTICAEQLKEGFAFNRGNLAVPGVGVLRSTKVIDGELFLTVG